MSPSLSRLSHTFPSRCVSFAPHNAWNTLTDLFLTTSAYVKDRDEPSDRQEAALIKMKCFDYQAIYIFSRRLTIRMTEHTNIRMTEHKWVVTNDDINKISSVAGRHLHGSHRVDWNYRLHVTKI